MVKANIILNYEFPLILSELYPLRLNKEKYINLEPISEEPTS